MNSESRGIAAALTRAWRAIARAFTPAGESRRAQPGADTTLFGTVEPPRTGRGRATRGDEFWDPAGTSTDFADPDLTGDSKRR